MAQKEGTAVSCKGLPKLFTFLFIFFLVITVPGTKSSICFFDIFDLRTQLINYVYVYRFFGCNKVSKTEM